MNGYGNFITKLARDLMGYLQNRPDVDLEALDHLSPLPVFDLGVARNNVKIHDRSGCRIFVTSLTGEASLRTRQSGHVYPLFKGSMSFPFRELYLTNTAQAGKTLSLTIGLQSFVDLDAQPEFTPTEKVKLQNIAEAIINPATQDTLALVKAKTDNLDITITALKDGLKANIAGGHGDPGGLGDILHELEDIHGYHFNKKSLYQVWDKLDYMYAFMMRWSHTVNIRNVTMTNADTEYYQPIDYDTHFITAHTRDGTEWRYAKTTGKVAAPTEPYWTVKTDTELKIEFIKASGYNFYCACGTAGKVVEIIESCT